MKVRTILCCAIVFASLFSGCGDKASSKEDAERMPEIEQIKYDKTLKKLNDILEEAVSGADAYRVEDEIRLLDYSYNAENMGEEAEKKCRALKDRINELKKNPEMAFQGPGMGSVAGSGQGSMLFKRRNIKFAGVLRLPYSLCKDDKLHLELNSQGTMIVSLYDVANERRISQWTVNGATDEEVAITTNGIYVVELKARGGTVLADVTLSYTGTDKSRRPHVREKLLPASPSQFLAIKQDSIVVSSVFREPKKIGLRGNLKSMFSGKSRALIAVPVPNNCDALLYSLRISTNEKTVPADGRFSDNLSLTTHKIKLFGVNVFEHSLSSGYIDRLLFNTRPVREDDAFCNLYVFKSSSQARKFQDGNKSSGNYTYDVKQSQMGTQSCNGRLYPNGNSTIYLGFENERMRYDNYIWLEVASLTHVTHYVRPVYSTR